MKKIIQASELLNMKQQEVMRLAMEIGLEDLERIQHNPAAAIVDKASQQPSTIDREALLQIALASFQDDSTPYFPRRRRRKTVQSAEVRESVTKSGEA